ncbi:MAG: 2-dehydro-3-deoxygalactonokinase [Rhizomicrobium sp.]
MGTPAFIAGDWGTTHLRLFLCDASAGVIAAKTGAGVAQAKAEDVFRALAAEWDAAHGKLPAVLCGMVGSTIGWRQVPYLACPAHPQAIAESALRFEDGGRAIVIAPGLSCRNRLLAPDMMRGEETQILGALALEPKLREGRRFLCMPGTHTKWVSLKDGAVEHFLTALTGELFDILRQHSVLVRSDGPADVSDGKIFASALDQTKMYPDAELIHLLFETRSRQLDGSLKQKDAAAYLSGLIIGQDVSGAKRFFRSDLAAAGHVTVIGAPKLCDFYVHALRTRDLAAGRIDGDAASLAGLAALYRGTIGRAVS